MKSIPVFRPMMGEEEVEAVRECLQSGWIGLGPHTAAFEDAFADFLGVPRGRVIGTNSCTAALDLALKLYDVAGGEVITTSITFVSTNHAILYNNAVPVFADVDPDTLNLDPDDVRRKVTARTRAIMVVHYGGHPADMDALRAIAAEAGVPLIEDAAHAAGAQYKGRMAGAIGDVGCFSFHAVKNIPMGEGGAVVVHDDAQAERLRRLRWCGIDRSTWERSSNTRYSWQYDVAELGYKYHLSDIAASLGLVQLRKFEQTRAARQHIYQRYQAAFADLPQVTPLAVRDDVRTNYLLYVLKAERRDELMDFLASEAKVGTSVHYYPNHLYELYQAYPADVPVTEAVWPQIITLPNWPAMTEEDVEHVIASVRAFYEHEPHPPTPSP